MRLTRFTPILLALLVAASGAARPAAQSGRTGVSYVAVTDAKGDAMAGLSASDFLVRVDGKDQPVLDARLATEPPAIVIIVDGYSDYFAQQMRRGLKSTLDLIRVMAPNATVGLMMAEGPTPPSMWPVNDDGGKLDRMAASYLRQGQSAPMLESIVVAAKTLGEVRSPRRLILVLTSQAGTLESTFTAQTVGEAVRISGASLWAIESTRATLEQQGTAECAKVLQEVTRASGGRRDQRYTWLIEEHAVAIMRLMLSQYAVTYGLPESRGAGYLRVGVARDNAVVYAPGWTTNR